MVLVSLVSLVLVVTMPVSREFDQKEIVQVARLRRSETLIVTLLLGYEVVKTGVPVPALQTATLVDKGKQAPSNQKEKKPAIGCG